MTLLDKAKELTERRKSDGGFVEEELQAKLEELIVIDVAAEKKRKAKAILNAAAKPGATEPSGQFYLPGLEPYDYEPNRLIRDDDGNIIEQSKSTMPYRTAQEKREKKHLEAAKICFNRTRLENKLFAEWIKEKWELGEPTIDLTFGNFVEETGYVKPIELVPEEVE